MPRPDKDESRKDFVKRCIPVVLHDETAKDGSQAAAMCNNIWRQEQKKPRSAAGRARGRTRYYARALGRED